MARRPSRRDLAARGRYIRQPRRHHLRRGQCPGPEQVWSTLAVPMLVDQRPHGYGLVVLVAATCPSGDRGLRAAGASFEFLADLVVDRGVGQGHPSSRRQPNPRRLRSVQRRIQIEAKGVALENGSPQTPRYRKICGMGAGYLDANGLAHRLDDGRQLFADVAFRVSTGQVTALVGANGAGKTTLLRMLSGELSPLAGGVTVQGGLGVMPQFIGSVRDDTTVRDLLLAVSPAALRAAAGELDDAELAMMDTDDEPTQLRYATALAGWGEAGGYDAEVLWDTVTVAALGVPYDRARFRSVSTLSGGEQKRLVLEALLQGREQVLLLDEPDNYLDVPGKRWLEGRLAAKIGRAHV